MAETRRGRADYLSDCVTCGERGPLGSYDGDTHRAWARRHADANPGHQAHVEHTVVRVYVGDKPPVQHGEADQ